MKEYEIIYKTAHGYPITMVLFAKDRDDAIKFLRRYYRGVKKIVSARALKREKKPHGHDDNDTGRKGRRDNLHGADAQRPDTVERIDIG